jgi:hypothetical protein
MLLKSHHKLVLQNQVTKILCFSTAFNNTFVFSRVINPGADESIVHVDVDGKVLFEHKYPDIINFFGMLNEREVIVMYVPESHIDIINLETQQVRHINHEYLFDDVAQMNIETFHDTKTFVIIEKGTFNDPRLRLTYYRYEDTYEPETCKHIAEFQSVDNQWTYEYPVKRANNHSMIAWFRYKHDAEIEFNYFDLREDPKNTKMTTVKINNTGGQPYNINNFSLSLATLWETKPGQFMLVANSNKEANGKNPDGIINNNYVVDVKAGTMRETKFWFKDPKDGFAWNEQMIEYFYMGPVSVFHTFRHEAGKTLTTPVFYVSNETEQEVAQETWEATCYVNFFVPGFDNGTVIEGFYENGDVKEVGVTVKKVMDPKEISLHFMLHLNEDFDDDLLSDAIDLLHG